MTSVRRSSRHAYYMTMESKHSVKLHQLSGLWTAGQSALGDSARSRKDRLRSKAAAVGNRTLDKSENKQWPAFLRTGARASAGSAALHTVPNPPLSAVTLTSPTWAPRPCEAVAGSCSCSGALSSTACVPGNSRGDLPRKGSRTELTGGGASRLV